jgi:O-antigen/teichoic acid export membrane protein
MSNNPIRQLAGETAIYGLGTIIPRLLNYFLVPFYTRVFEQDEYGQITEL